MENSWKIHLPTLNRENRDGSFDVILVAGKGSWLYHGLNFYSLRQQGNPMAWVQLLSKVY